MYSKNRQLHFTDGPQTKDKVVMCLVKHHAMRKHGGGEL
jgi:hypothetical protein